MASVSFAFFWSVCLGLVPWQHAQSVTSVLAAGQCHGEAVVSVDCCRSVRFNWCSQEELKVKAVERLVGCGAVSVGAGCALVALGRWLRRFCHGASGGGRWRKVSLRSLGIRRLVLDFGNPKSVSVSEPAHLLS